MCALRAHIKLSICGNNFSGIEKVITAFHAITALLPP